SYWEHNDYRLHTANGNLPQRLAGLPLWLSGDFEFPDVHQAEGWRTSDEWSVGRELLFASGNDTDEMMFRARAMITLMGVLLGITLYCWSLSIANWQVALVILSLFTFSPSALAQGGLVTSDMTLAVTLLWAALASWRLVRHRSVANTLLCGLTWGLLFVSKMSAVAIVPICALMMLAHFVLLRRGVLSTTMHAVPAVVAWGCVGLLAWGAIWAFYGFRYAGLDVAVEQSNYFIDWSQLLTGSPLVASAISAMRTVQVLPEAYLHGFAFMLTFAAERLAFFLGEVRFTGWWYFFPVATAIKTPLAIFVLMTIGVVALTTWRGADASVHKRRLVVGLVPLLSVFVVYWALAVSSSLNIGYRHMFPVVPALLVFAGFAWYARHRVVRWVVVGLVLSVVIESMAVRPHYLGYFNLLVGGPSNGYRYMSDSSVEWGQDLPELSRWLKQNAAGRRTYLSYFGSSVPSQYGVNAEVLPSFFELSRSGGVAYEPGLYCISATMLQPIYVLAKGPWQPAYEEDYQRLRHLYGSGPMVNPPNDNGKGFWLYDNLRFARLIAYLRTQTPAHRIGLGFHIFDLNEADLKVALEGPAPFPKG
nr:hypothetical protein [Gammaproteobacteria bacterium]